MVQDARSPEAVVRRKLELHFVEDVPVEVQMLPAHGSREAALCLVESAAGSPRAEVPGLIPGPGFWRGSRGWTRLEPRIGCEAGSAGGG